MFFEAFDQRAENKIPHQPACWQFVDQIDNLFFYKDWQFFRVWQLLTYLTISGQLVNMLWCVISKVEYGGQPSWRSQGCLMILIMEINIVLWMYWLWWLYGNYDDHDDFDDYDDFDFDYININKVEWFANILMRRTFAKGCNFKTFFTQDFCCNAKAYRIHALANLKCFRYFCKMPARTVPWVLAVFHGISFVDNLFKVLKLQILISYLYLYY